MWNFIEKLQKKPEHERKRILMITTAAITLVVFAFWIASFRNTLTESSQAKKTVETTPFSVLKNNLGSAYEGILGSFQSSGATEAPPPATDATTTNGQE